MVGLGDAAAAPGVPPEIGLLLLFALVGAFAGAVRAAQGAQKPRPALWDVLSQSAGGGLTSFLAGCMCLSYWGTTRLYLSLAIVGVAGWAGTVLISETFALFARYAADRLHNLGGPPVPPTPLPSPQPPPPGQKEPPEP